MSEILIEAKRIRVDYLGGYTALKEVSLKLAPKDILIVYGISGAGKTTLLRVLSGLDDVSDGTIELSGKNLRDVAPEARNIGYTFDSSVLDKRKRVEDVLAYPLRLRGAQSEEIEKRVRELCLEYGLDRETIIRDLSASEKAKLILARLFSVERKIYLVDDLTKDLNEGERREYYSLLTDKLADKSAVIVSEDEYFARTFGKDNLLIMHDGCGCDQNTLKGISGRPSDMTSAQFCGYELFTGTLERIDGEYSAVLDEDGKTAKVAAPISRVYEGKRVCFAVKDGRIMPFYYDLSCERIISSHEDKI